MGEFDFLGGFDFGDMGNLAAGGTAGGNVPNLPDFNLNLPDIPGGGAGGLGSLGLSQTPQSFPLPGLPPGGGVMAPGQQVPQQPSGGLLGSVLGQGTPGGGILKDITGLAGVGLQGLGIKNQIDALHAAKQQTRQTGAMQEIQKKSAEPLQQFGTQQLQQASAGHIDPAAQAMIDQWLQAEKQKMQQFFASQGISNSTMLQSAMADLDSKAVAMRNSVLGQDKNTAIAALSRAMQGATAGAATAGREQDALDNIIAQANKAMAQLAGAAA